jgi:hypothetical protein
LPRRVTIMRLRATASFHPPAPYMEHLHVAMSAVGRQAARVIATPALPHRSQLRECPGSGQVAPWGRAAAAMQEIAAAVTAP